MIKILTMVKNPGPDPRLKIRVGLTNWIRIRQITDPESGAVVYINLPGCCSLPCNHCNNWTWDVKEMAYGLMVIAAALCAMQGVP